MMGCQNRAMGYALTFDPDPVARGQDIVWFLTGEPNTSTVMKCEDPNGTGDTFELTFSFDSEGYATTSAAFPAEWGPTVRYTWGSNEQVEPVA